MAGGDDPRPTDGRDALATQLLASIESMADGFVLLDRDWRFAYVNATAEALLQHSRDALIGRNMWEVFPEGLGTIAEQEYAKVMRGGGSSTFELYFPPIGLWLEVRALASSHGGMSIYFRDVSERHAAQETMRLLQSAVSRLSDIVVVSKASPVADERVIVFVNEAFERVLGFPQAEVIGRTIGFLHGPRTDAQEVIRARAELMSGRSAHTEIINYAKDGREVWLEGDISPLLDESGTTTHFLVVSRDVTERKRAELALRESNERFRIVAQATADVVWDWNLIDDTIWWSEGIRQFGYAPEDLPPTSESWTNHIHAEDLERVTAGIHRIIDGGEEKWSDEYRLLRADGSSAQVVDRGAVIRDDAGKAIRMIGSLNDVTAQRELEAQLRQSQRLEAVGQLTGGVAHDFNNLLTVILSNAELLESRLAGDDQLRMLAEMTRLAAERGAELTSRLLAFSRRQALDPRATDVKALVQGMESLLRRALGEGVAIRVVAVDGLWDALIDGLQLESALLNLSINARDAMLGGGSLTISVENVTLDDERAGDYVMLAVADTGTGMDETTLARVFEPFFTTKEVGKGSGLGLSMVYGFVTQSKGHVEIDTAPGAGTTVKLYLPRAREARRAADTSVADQPATGRERVLLVEDDDLVRMQAGSELQSLGYRVVSARNGAEALQILNDGQRFDLLFTDVLMAGMNGRQLAEAACAIDPHMAVLFTSGHSETLMAEEGRMAPGVILLRKPYRRRELAAKLREALVARLV